MQFKKQATGIIERQSEFGGVVFQRWHTLYIVALDGYKYLSFFPESFAPHQATLGNWAVKQISLYLC